MMKYILPSASISTVLLSYFGQANKEKRKPSSVSEAVHCLNKNECVDDAIDIILHTNAGDSADLSKLSARSVGALASHGWNVPSTFVVKRFKPNDEDLCFEKLLSQLGLGEEYREALEWLHRISREEADISRTDALIGRLRSQSAQLQQILQELFLRTDNASNAPEMDEAVVHFLYAMYMAFQKENKKKSAIFVDNLTPIVALKTLANIALMGERYANIILTSEWLHLLTHLAVNGHTLRERLIAHKVFRNALYSLGVSNCALRSDIYELHLPQKEPVMDVVMIHGLKGSIGWTWRQQFEWGKPMSMCWPKDWLPQDITAPIRIVGIEYPSYIFTGTALSLQARVDRLRVQMREAGVGSRPVAFICHSLGGLVAKRMLLDMPELRKQTVGILFIATPHRGSPFATWQYEIVGPSEDVIFLRGNNEINKKLDADFSGIHDAIPLITSMVETRELTVWGSPKGFVVPGASAAYPRGSLYHIDEMHHNMCKPSARSSLAYSVILNFVRDALFEANKLSN